ncbi:MAG: HAMP domain-containing histidine kinase [Rubrivivax sp.]|nr:HAMP domain-containing histidine kinase [Rubrivivax sp.]
MTVRARLALTILLTGLATTLALLFTVATAFQRFEHESTWERANGFIGRVVATHPDLLDLHMRDPEGFTGFLRNLLLFEPNSRLYLLAADGTVLASSGQMPLAPGFKVKLAPVKEAVMTAGDRARAAYVMGDDPEYMSADTVIAARPLRATVIRAADEVAGYLYLVCQKAPLPAGRLDLLRSSVTGPALMGVVVVVLLGSLIATWVIGTVTRPLRELSDTVDAAARDGFEAAQQVQPAALPPRGDDEFTRLRAGFQAMLARLHAQWDRLRRLDQFRREGVSNLSHDLRSPLTATTAGLETLERRWAGDPARAEDRALLQVALRNTAHAAGMVRALADFALLDEPSYRLQPVPMDVGELLDDVAMRFAGRAAQAGILLRCEHAADPVIAALDVELFERALANLLDNALKLTPAGGHITLSARHEEDQVVVAVSDTGPGIAADQLPLLFERFYRKSEGGHGLGLAIVGRIVGLHGGQVQAQSAPDQGMHITIRLPASL